MVQKEEQAREDESRDVDVCVCVCVCVCGIQCQLCDRPVMSWLVMYVQKYVCRPCLLFAWVGRHPKEKGKKRVSLALALALALVLGLVLVLGWLDGSRCGVETPWMHTRTVPVEHGCTKYASQWVGEMRSSTIL